MLEVPTAPAAPPVPAAPPAPPVPAAPELPAADARAVGGVAMIAAVGAGAIFLLNTVTLPTVIAKNAVVLFIAAAGCVAAVRWVRTGVRKQARTAAASKVAEFGGGVYGAAAAATLLYLEMADLGAEVAAAGSLGAFVRAMNLDWLIHQGIESIGFAITAAMWPWHWLSEFGAKTAVLVAAGVWTLDAAARTVAPRIAARWQRRSKTSVSSVPSV